VRQPCLLIGEASPAKMASAVNINTAKCWERCICLFHHSRYYLGTRVNRVACHFITHIYSHRWAAFFSKHLAREFNQKLLAILSYRSLHFATYLMPNSVATRPLLPRTSRLCFIMPRRRDAWWYYLFFGHIFWLTWLFFWIAYFCYHTPSRCAERFTIFHHRGARRIRYNNR